jgi:hypothetical protein
MVMKRQELGAFYYTLYEFMHHASEMQMVMEKIMSLSWYVWALTGVWLVVAGHFCGLYRRRQQQTLPYVSKIN